MKRQIAMIALLFLGMGMTASAQFGKKFNVGKALQAGKDVVSAVTLSDADIANMSKEYMVWMDAHNPLTKPDTEYGKTSGEVDRPHQRNGRAETELRCL